MHITSFSCDITNICLCFNSWYSSYWFSPRLHRHVNGKWASNFNYLPKNRHFETECIIKKNIFLINQNQTFKNAYIWLWLWKAETINRLENPTSLLNNVDIWNTFIFPKLSEAVWKFRNRKRKQKCRQRGRRLMECIWTSHNVIHFHFEMPEKAMISFFSFSFYYNSVET